MASFRPSETIYTVFGRSSHASILPPVLTRVDVYKRQAKSILGMMSLDYSHPVKIVCEDERDLNSVVNAIKQ